METISRIQPRLDRLGVPLPKAAQTLIEVSRALNEAANTNPTHELEQELLAGKLTPANARKRALEAARLLTEQERARDVVRDLDRTFNLLDRQFVHEHGDELVDALRSVFDASVEVLQRSLEMFGAKPDLEAVALVPALAEQHKAHREAMDRLHDVRRIREALADAGYGMAQVPVTYYLAAVRDGDDLTAALHDFQPDRVASLVANGRAVHLNNAAEVEAIETQCRSVAEARTAEQEQARRDAIDQRRADRKAELERDREQNRAMRELAGLEAK